MLVAKSEYVKFLMSPKNTMLIVIFLILHDVVIMPMLQASSQMGSPLNAIEPFLATLKIGMILFALVYLFLISSFPGIDGNMMFYIERMGRKNWILGEILFQFMSAFTYILLIIIVTAAQTFQYCFLSNGWSLVATDYDELYAAEGGIHMSGFIPPNLYFQLPPYKAFFLSVALFFCFLLLCGMIILLGCLVQKRVLLFFVQVLHIMGGYALITIKSPAKWFFPMTHAQLSLHYQRYFRAYLFPPWLSLLLFIIFLLGIGIFVYHKAKKVSIDLIGGEVLS